MHNKGYWVNWLRRSGIRAARTIAQSAIASIGVASAMGEVDWMYVLSTAVIAGAISLLSSIRGLPEIRMEEQLLNVQRENQENMVEEAEDIE